MHLLHTFLIAVFLKNASASKVAVLQSSAVRVGAGGGGRGGRRAGGLGQEVEEHLSFTAISKQHFGLCHGDR